MKLIKMEIRTGYHGANHYDEFELDTTDMTDEEIEKEANDAVTDFIAEMIDGNYTIEDI